MTTRVLIENPPPVSSTYTIEGLNRQLALFIYAVTQHTGGSPDRSIRGEISRLGIQLYKELQKGGVARNIQEEYKELFKSSLYISKAINESVHPIPVYRNENLDGPDESLIL